MRLRGGYVTLALIVLLGYVVVELLAFIFVRQLNLPIGSALESFLGLGDVGAVLVLGAAGVALAFVDGAILSGRLPVGKAPKEAAAPPPPEQKGLARSSLNKLLDESARNFVEVFPLRTGAINVYGAISKEEGVEGYKYVVIEPELTPVEQKQFAQMKELLIEEMDVDLRSIETREKAESFLASRVAKLAQTYAYNIPRPSMRKLQYYFARDFIHLGKIEPFMLDPLIEDISCDGANIPIYVWHRDYESIPTNVIFETDTELDTFVSKLAYVSGKHISLAAPLVDASLHDGSRLHLTYGKEITQRGSTFTIRKFKADPFTIIDLVKYNTLNAEVAAYLWYLVEKKMSMLVAGGTASGKSVPGDEKVLVYRGGREQLVAISRLYQEAAATGEVRREGTYETALPEGWRTAAFGPDLKVRQFDVKAVIRHEAPKSVFRLKTRSGREVSATGSHSIFTLRDGEVTPFPVSELSPGAFVGVPRVIPEPAEAPQAVDLVEALRHDDGGMYVENVAGDLRKLVDLVGIEAAAGELGLSKTSVRLCLSSGFAAVRVTTYMKLLGFLGEKPDSSRLAIRPKTNRQLSVPATLKVTKDLMRLLGYWVSEGTYQRGGISLFQLGQEARSDMIATAKAAFGAELAPSKGSDPTRLDLRSSVVRAIFEKALGMKGGSADKSIPEIALQQKNPLLAEFLRGYFTGDAWARTYVEASTKSRELAAQLQHALARFGMVASVRTKIVKGTRYHGVFLYGQTNLRRFAETIGFASPEKQSVLVEHATRRIPPHTNVDTIPAAPSLLKDALRFESGNQRGQLWSDWHSYWSSPEQIGRDTLVEFVGASGAEGSLKDRLLDLAYSDIFWDEVVSVEEVPFGEKWVYDLEVPGAQNFVGGSGGVFLHNTTSLNTLSMFITPGQKVISVEDTPELNLPQENWIQEVSRSEGSAGEITLFDLVRNALRQRPDVIIVGEIRGKEAFTLFQAISTGHGGMGTIHADSVEAVFNRLTTEPMSLPRSLVGTSLDCIILQLKLRIGDRSVRRIVSVNEILGYDNRTNEMVMNEVYRWDPTADRIIPTGRSRLVEKINQRFGIGPDEVRRDLEARKVFLEWLARKNYRSYKEVSSYVREFYSNPYATSGRARSELEAMA